jgi:hypothetical protein
VECTEYGAERGTSRDRPRERSFFDRSLNSHRRQVHEVWILGSVAEQNWRGTAAVSLRPPPSFSPLTAPLPLFTLRYCLTHQHEQSTGRRSCLPACLDTRCHRRRAYNQPARLKLCNECTLSNLILVANTAGDGGCRPLASRLPAPASQVMRICKPIKRLAEWQTDEKSDPPFRRSWYTPHAPTRTPSSAASMLRPPSGTRDRVEKRHPGLSNRTSSSAGAQENCTKALNERGNGSLHLEL